MEQILIIGAGGQIGVELTQALRIGYGRNQVIASDIREVPALLDDNGPFEQLDVLDAKAVAALIQKYRITQVYLLAAILSAKGETAPKWAWDINMPSLLNLLEICRENKVRKFYWPSSIAAFGPTTPRKNTPQHTIMEPTTVYGISKYAGELWCQYYFNRYGLDIRSLRYPGVISWKSPPGGGTTDYAIEIFTEALSHQHYNCFLAEDTYLPMIYMPDAIRATIELMEAPSEKIKNRMSYNLASMSFAPKDIAACIRKHIPEFTINYQPDFRQQIAEGWPQSIDDSEARQDWGWNPEFDLDNMTADMLKNLAKP